MTIGLAHRAKAGIRRVGRADYQAGGNRSYSGIDLARARFPIVFDSRGEPAYLAQAQPAPGTLGSAASAALARALQGVSALGYRVSSS